jgi:hypothetical protein
MKQILAVLLLTAYCLAADPEPYLKSAPMPFYPRLARLARLSGQVSLHFLVDGNGNTSQIEAEAKTDAVNGAGLLRDDAIENIRNWRFAWPRPCSCRSRREAVFVYKISSELESPERPNVTVRWFGEVDTIRVELEGDPIERDH